MPQRDYPSLPDTVDPQLRMAVRRAFDYIYELAERITAAASPSAPSGSSSNLIGTHVERTLLLPHTLPLGTTFTETDHYQAVYQVQLLGTAHVWVLIIPGAAGLTTLNVVPKLGTADVFSSSAISDDGTNVVMTGRGLQVGNTAGIGIAPLTYMGVRVGGTITAASGIAVGVNIGSITTLKASADSDVLSAITIAPTFDDNGKASVVRYAINSASTEQSRFAGDVLFEAKVGFYNAAAVAQQTLNAYVSDSEGVAYTGIVNTMPGAVYAQVSDLNLLRVAYENLRAMCDDLRTKLQGTTLVA